MYIIKYPVCVQVYEHMYAHMYECYNHYENARELLHRLRGANMQSESVQQANQIAESLRDDMRRTEENLINVVQSKLRTQRDTQKEVTLPSENPQAPSLVDLNLAATTSASLYENTQLAILQALRDLNVQMQNRPPPFRGNPNPRNARLRHYCWSHGRCNHPSSQCRAKKQGHKDEATLRNKLGGSTKNCE